MSKVSFTTKAGQQVSRNTNTAYTVAIVGTNKDGKLVIAFASKNVNAAKDLFTKIATAEKGSVVACKFAGLSNLEIVESDKEEQLTTISCHVPEKTKQHIKMMAEKLAARMAK